VTFVAAVAATSPICSPWCAAPPPIRRRRRTRPLSIILVPRPERGFRYEGAIDMLGHLAPTFHREDVRVLKENVLGHVGAGKALTDAKTMHRRSRRPARSFRRCPGRVCRRYTP
jgi:alkylation response protein AidB-like acyl-CoA dehydrogenase